MKKYSDDEVIELLCLGGISLCVTLTNIVCIYLMGIILMYFKEVAPVAENQRQFWKHDIKIARDYNKTLNAEDAKKLEAEVVGFHVNPVENFKGVGAELLRQNLYHSTQTWSPFTHRHHRSDTYKTQKSIRNLEILFKPMEKHHHTLGSPEQKYSTPIFISPKTSNDYLKMPSAPLEVISEVPRFLQNQQSVCFDEPGPSQQTKKKFIVTPARDL